ncbi:MAG: ABC transporter [Sulfobacillus benefaciens]|uniref:ABC transporter n=1 Tax=Sulfobacillus benefaciens TaxID=453960 RepID=A0A2T2X8F2_9FIRM|nr:MAG: ABC transporter [Sulfobacillus benefaciens]
MPTPQNESVISLRNLQVNYGNTKVLEDINLEVQSGQIIGYIGPNGAGKSTTIKAILGLITDYSGTITVLGHDVAGGDVAYKAQVGYVPESAELYEALTAEEYLNFVGTLYGLPEKKAASKSQELIRLLGLEEAYRSRLSSYSKGMKQKVLLISSLLHNPEILFLDEPLSGLDANSVMIVKDLMAELKEAGKTIFYSSHIMDVVEKISSRIILLNQGRVIADGDFATLSQKAHEQSLEEIFGHMTGFFEHQNIAHQALLVIQED